MGNIDCFQNYFEGITGDPDIDGISGAITVSNNFSGTADIYKNFFVCIPNEAAIGINEENAVSVNILNNTIYNCGLDFEVRYGGDITAENNIAYQCSTDVRVDTIYLDSTHYTRDPLFAGPLTQVSNPTDITVKDFNEYYSELTSPFKLQITSPCIDAGVNVGLPYSGTKPDIGALEYDQQ